MSVQKLKVLVLAELCNPEWASVPLVGWNHVHFLSEKVCLDVVTQKYNEEAIKPYTSASLSPFYVSNPLVDRLYQWIIDRFFAGAYGSATLTFVKIPFYYYFELKAAFIILKNHKKRGWQLIHRITPVSPVIASPIAFLAKLMKIPFVIGPQNGGLPWPPGYDHAASEKSRLAAIRNIYRYDPFIFFTRLFATRIFAGSKHTLGEFSRDLQSKVVYYPENGIRAENLIANRSYFKTGDCLKAVFVGRLVPLKCPQVAVRAARSFIEKGKMKLDIFGDGPERETLEKMIDHSSVTFHGWIASQQDLVARLNEFDILIFPSVKEFGGGVVIEAMAKGVVPIVMNYGGPSEIVRDKDGFLIEVSNEEKSIEDIKKVLSQIFADPSLIAEKSRSAVQRIRESFTWESKTSFVAEEYRKVVSRC